MQPFIRKKATCKRRLFYVLSALGFVLLGAIPLLQLSGYYLQRANAFPVIVDFNANWSDSFVRFNKAEIEAISGRTVDGDSLFRFRFDSGRYPGVSIFETVPNWSDYRRLRFKVASDRDNDTVLSLRVHEKNHNNNHQDRFNQKLIIRPGLNEIIIPLAEIEKGPLNRDLDLTNIAGVIIYMSKVEKPQRLEISNIYLD